MHGLYLNIKKRQSAAKEVNIMANKFSIEDYQERINLLFPEWNYEIIEFNGYKKPAKVLCKQCGKILDFRQAADITRKINVCDCYQHFNNFHDKFQYLSKQCDFTIIEDVQNEQYKKIKCNKCGTIMSRSIVSILNTPMHCDGCHKYREGESHYTQEEIQTKLNKEFYNEYELLEYHGITKDALLKHKNCGFIFKIRQLHDLFNGRNRGCPKCYQFKSKGEQAIMRYLENNHINYIPQKTFAPLNKSKYRFDFFIPDYNLAIEYQGEQHFYDTHWFNEDLNSTQKRDIVKRDYCKENNIELLEIPYWKYDKINQILTERFNDYLERE